MNIPEGFYPVVATNPKLKYGNSQKSISGFLQLLLETGQIILGLFHLLAQGDQPITINAESGYFTDTEGNKLTNVVAYQPLT